MDSVAGSASGGDLEGVIRIEDEKTRSHVGKVASSWDIALYAGKTGLSLGISRFSHDSALAATAFIQPLAE